MRAAKNWWLTRVVLNVQGANTKHCWASQQWHPMRDVVGGDGEVSGRVAE